jgi:hypothetical protein
MDSFHRNLLFSKSISKKAAGRSDAPRAGLCPAAFPTFAIMTDLDFFENKINTQKTVNRVDGTCSAKQAASFTWEAALGCESARPYGIA